MKAPQDSGRTSSPTIKAKLRVEPEGSHPPRSPLPCPGLNQGVCALPASQYFTFQELCSAIVNLLHDTSPFQTLRGSLNGYAESCTCTLHPTMSCLCRADTTLGVRKAGVRTGRCCMYTTGCFMRLSTWHLPPSCPLTLGYKNPWTNSSYCCLPYCLPVSAKFQKISSQSTK
jgi:hypothetical protein